MKFLRKFGNALHSRIGTCIFFALAAMALVFLHSSRWAFGWMAEVYPAWFIPLLFTLMIVCAVVTFVFPLAVSLFGEEKIKNIRGLTSIYTAFAVLTGTLFGYALVLLFGLDTGVHSYRLMNGIQSLTPNLVFIGVAIGLLTLFLWGKQPKKIAQTALIILTAGAVIFSPAWLTARVVETRWEGQNFVPVTLQSENVLQGATVVFESLRYGQQPSGEYLLEDNNAVWAPLYPARRPAPGHRDINNAFVEIQLAQVSTFNLAMIKEVGNQVQYFRLQALVDGEWFTFYQSEKIQAMRLCSFDAVTTDRIRINVDLWRSEDVPARIRSLRLYNEPRRQSGNFEVVSYMRLDRDRPTEILAQGEEHARTFARFFDVYSTIIIFAAINWDRDGQMNFAGWTEEEFARELEALRELIDLRSNLEHEVQVIVTTLPDGAFESNHTSVNYYMHQHWETVADQTIAFAQRHNLDGVDIDWEYPQNAADWRLFDQFIARLDDGLKAQNPDAILSAALLSNALGMQPETLARFDQIQFMAYDGNDMDGFQSSLQQAQEGLVAFLNAGAQLSRINIGIPAYGRPINGSPYWKPWRDLATANYWDNRYFVLDSDYQTPNAGQIYIGTFNSPALAGDKTAYALFSGAGGVMVFRISTDKLMDTEIAVANGIENALRRHLEDW